VCALVAWSGWAMPAPAFAQPPASAGAADQARSLLKEGSSLYLAGKYTEALSVLKSSYDLVPSPNSSLLIARCLRGLGRLVESQDVYASTEAEARKRASEGAPKYTQTAESAATEGAAVRAALGTVRIRIEGVDPGAKLEIDGVPIEISEGGDQVVWHEPGEVTVALKSASGLEQKQVVTVSAGAEVTVGFGRAEPPPGTEPPPQLPLSPGTDVPNLAAAPLRERGLTAPSPHGASWAVPAAVTSGALTLVGAGLFAGFGLASRSTYQRLWNDCGKMRTCYTPEQHSRADAGQNEQLIANVSGIAGSAAGVATIVFAILAANQAAPAKPRRGSLAAAFSGEGEGWHLLVGVGSLGVLHEIP
jgi:hypothetical protein